MFYAQFPIVCTGRNILCRRRQHNLYLSIIAYVRLVQYGVSKRTFPHRSTVVFFIGVGYVSGEVNIYRASVFANKFDL